MYGKKRIVINKKNQIIRTGGGTYGVIGYITKFPNTKNVVAKFLRHDNRFDRELRDDNTITMGGMKVNDIRVAIKKLYNIA